MASLAIVLHWYWIIKVLIILLGSPGWSVSSLFMCNKITKAQCIYQNCWIMYRHCSRQLPVWPLLRSTLECRRKLSEEVNLGYLLILQASADVFWISSTGNSCGMINRLRTISIKFISVRKPICDIVFCAMAFWFRLS